MVTEDNHWNSYYHPRYSLGQTIPIQHNFYLNLIYA